jgi:hypothetical protein
VAPRAISVTQAIASVLAVRDMSEEKGSEKELQAGAPEGEKPSVTGPDKQTKEPPPSSLKADTGFINASDPVTHLSEKLDVVYLPDFEEQYVIQPKTGLGQARIETRLRNGWAAEVFSQAVDNSNLIPYVIRQVEQASNAAAGIATTWIPAAMGLPPGTKPLAAFKSFGLEAGDVEDADEAARVLGGILLFKVAEVRVAQPGLYPILKPREIRQWLKIGSIISDEDPEATFETFIQQANVPWIRPDMTFVPAPPFTVIGFNTTTDVFLAPSSQPTQPMNPETTGGVAPPDRSVADSIDKERIKKALMEGKGNSIDNAINSLSENDIAIRATDGSKGTVIRMQSSQFKPENLEKYKLWVLQALKRNSQELEAQLSQDNRHLDFKFLKVPLSELASILEEP